MHKEEWIKFDDGHGLIVYEGTKIISEASFTYKSDGSAHITLIKVPDPRNRGQGYGYKIYCEIEKKLRSMNIKTITLDASEIDPFTPQDKVEAFWRRQGFLPQTSSAPADGLLMVKTL